MLLVILGVHLEGPFINVEKKGAHQEKYIQNKVSPSAVKECYGSGLDDARIVTLAPELMGSEETIRWLTKDCQVVVSLGHSMSALDTAEKAFTCGASLITHLFNAMLPVQLGEREGRGKRIARGGGGELMMHV